MPAASALETLPTSSSEVSTTSLHIGALLMNSCTPSTPPSGRPPMSMMSTSARCSRPPPPPVGYAPNVDDETARARLGWGGLRVEPRCPLGHQREPSGVDDSL